MRFELTDACYLNAVKKRSKLVASGDHDNWSYSVYKTNSGQILITKEQNGQMFKADSEDMPNQLTGFGALIPTEIWPSMLSQIAKSW